ncbi:unnamed protein product, partial [Larinioides sclopetarius]
AKKTIGYSVAFRKHRSMIGRQRFCIRNLRR